MFVYIQPNQIRRHWTRTLVNQSFVSFYKNRPRLQFYWLISLAPLRHGIHFLLSFLTNKPDDRFQRRKGSELADASLSF